MLKKITLEEEILITEFFLKQKNTEVMVNSELRRIIEKKEEIKSDCTIQPYDIFCLGEETLYWLEIEYYTDSISNNTHNNSLFLEKIILLGYSKNNLFLNEGYFLEKKDLKKIKEYFSFKTSFKNNLYVVERIKRYGPAGIRTPDLQLRRLSPYPD